MKVLIVNKSIKNGGAAIAANRLFEALKNNGTQVKMLVEDEVDETVDIQCIANTKAKKNQSFYRFVLERLYFLPREKNKSVRFQFSPGKTGVDISQHPWVQEADVIHLHWINHGFLSLKGLQKLFGQNKPVVWTMHDMWPFTGGCHYAGTCDRFMQGCGTCPLLRFPRKHDFSSVIHQRKKNIWDNAPIHAVGCSKWIAGLAQKSTLLQSKQVTNIPNPIDTDVFTTLNKKECRDVFGFPQNKKLLLFGAANMNDPRKGFRQLVQALEFLNVKHAQLMSDLELVVFGKCDEHQMNKLPYKWHKVDFVSDAARIAQLYNCADAFVLPSMEDNLPNTVMEALACGVPVVAFNIGGVPEMVKHNETGYVAAKNNSDDLALGIYDVIYKNNAESLKFSARSFVMENYTQKIVAKQYNDLYTSLIRK